MLLPPTSGIRLHLTPLQAGPPASLPLPISTLPRQSGLHHSQKDSARAHIGSCLTPAPKLPGAPQSSPWVQGPTGPGLHVWLTSLPNPPSQSLGSSPISFLTVPQRRQSQLHPRVFARLFPLPGTSFLPLTPSLTSSRSSLQFTAASP